MLKTTLDFPPIAPQPADDDLSQRYADALAWLYGRINYEATPPARRGKRSLKLERMRQLMDRLDWPGISIPTVHVAGSKGKGSTATMIASILKASGLRVGLFTSPHLQRIEERFCVDAQPATAAQFVQLVQRLSPVVEEMDRLTKDALPPPTYFEICTAIALLHFQQRQVDAMVLEVGLGGRLDSTNVCRPDVCVITSISLDHTRQLGNSLAAIAGEKAGIIKQGVPVVCGVCQAEPQAVIHQVAAKLSCQVLQLGRDFQYGHSVRECSDTVATGDLVSFDWSGESTGQFINRSWQSTEALQRVSLSLMGEHQAANASIALATAAVLAQRGWSVTPSDARTGLKQTHLAARAEMVRRQPLIILDTAHNVASSQALADLIQSRFTGRRKELIFAPTSDKDVGGMLGILLPLFDKVRLTRYRSNPRGVPLDQLVHLVGEWRCRLDSETLEVTEYASPTDALDASLRSARSDDLICICGSFFIAAELRPALVNGD